MCGLAGAMSFEGAQFRVSESYLTLLRDTMVHRGPDAGRTWISADGRVGLAHRRLSIIDLADTATQPMCNEDGTLWTVFNGEIYNHAEIRAELERKGGHVWKTSHSDTEIILHAFEEWGIACLDKFRGMFAIALWDSRNEELWLIRDRVGIKPLYVSQHHGRVVFASEIKALLQDPQQHRAVNEESLFHYLSFITTPAPATMFDGISKLPPGTWMKFNRRGDVVQRRYWDAWDHAEPLTNCTEDEIAERIRAELQTAVALHKASDVPVGVFLSGGIDSSANTALFSRDAGSGVKTFTIGYQGDYRSYHNETHYARRMATFVGADHHEQLLTVDDLLDFLPRMIHLQDEPLGDPVCVPVYYVSKLARDNGVVVCQVGEGADELFWGYPTWKLRWRLQRADDLPVPQFLKRGLLAGMRGCGLRESLPLPYEALRRSTQNQPVFWGGADCFTDSQKQRLLSQRMNRAFAGRTSWEVLEPIHRRFIENAWEPSHLHWMSYLDLNIRLPELLLMRVDKMSMGTSLEARVPFLDHKLVELALGIPEAVKTKNGTLKYILKKAVRGLVPDELIDRPKQGFGVPVYEWLFEKLGDRARHEVLDFCRRTDYLDTAEVERLFERKPSANIWYLLNLALWWKVHIDGGSVSEIAA